VASNGPLPLAGVRVLDCSRVLAGPFATMLLADLGAEVVKLEPPGGDESRGWGPPWWGEAAQLRSAYFAAVNRNKRSVVVDLRTAAGRDILDRLAARSDLLVHNARPAQAARLGLDADRLEERHPHLVVACVGGFPGGSLEAARPAYDLLAQAVSGLMAVTGGQDGPPTKVGVALLDLLAGLELAVGALAAMVGRGQFGAARRRVEVSLVEAGVAGLINVLGNHLATGEEPGRWGNEHPNIVPYQVFAARDGYLAVAVGNDAQYARLLRALELAPDSRHVTNALRVAHRAEVVASLMRAIARRERDELLAALAAADVPAGPVNQVGEAVAAMEAAHEGRWLQMADGIRLPPDPIRIDGERLPLLSAPPRLGEQTDQVLLETGLSAAEISDLRSHGVVA
jgi:crotonobetainyl-CoA:carnitine CoA-transferase CaiB-like acyl-CoA transferase